MLVAPVNTFRVMTLRSILAQSRFRSYDQGKTLNSSRNADQLGGQMPSQTKGQFFVYSVDRLVANSVTDSLRVVINGERGLYKAQSRRY